MDLKSVLREVESFCGVMSLAELLESVKLGGGLEREGAEIKKFAQETLVLIDREILTTKREKAVVDLKEFINELEPLIGCNKVHINDFISSRYEYFPSNHIQKKDIMSKHL